MKKEKGRMEGRWMERRGEKNEGEMKIYMEWRKRAGKEGWERRKEGRKRWGGRGKGKTACKSSHKREGKKEAGRKGRER